MFASFVFALAFADLLLDLLFHQIDRGIEIAFAIFREQIRAAHAQANRTAKLPFRNPHVIVLERDARVQDPGVQAIQLLELREHVLLNGIRQRYVVRGEDQLHTDNMQSRPVIFNRQFPAQCLTADGHGYGKGKFTRIARIFTNSEMLNLIRVIQAKSFLVFVPICEISGAENLPIAQTLFRE
jgi:hypothetical protein